MTVRGTCSRAKPSILTAKFGRSQGKVDKSWPSCPSRSRHTPHSAISGMPHHNLGSGRTWPYRPAGLKENFLCMKSVLNLKFLDGLESLSTWSGIFWSNITDWEERRKSHRSAKSIASQWHRLENDVINFLPIGQRRQQVRKLCIRLERYRVQI